MLTLGVFLSYASGPAIPPTIDLEEGEALYVYETCPGGGLDV